MSLERQRKIVNRVFQRGDVTRADLAQHLDLNAATIVRLVAGLLELGLLKSHAGTSTDRGRPTEILSLNPDAVKAIGLEFSRDHCLLVILNTLGEVTHQASLPVPEFKANKVTLEALIKSLQTAVQKQGIAWSQVLSVGLSLHDIVDANGVWQTHEQPDSPFNVQAYVSERLMRTVVAEDVSRSFAFAEQKKGSGLEQKDMIYVFLGSHGVGSGIFVNGTLLKSSSGVCGELGHIVVEANGDQCHCGSQGCLETVATHQAIEARFDERVKQGVKTVLGPGAKFADICRAAAEGDKPAFLVLDELAQHLGQALAAATNISGAPLIIIGGQLKLAGDGFLRSVETALKRRVIAPLLKNIEVRYAALTPNAGAWGAASMALEKAFESGAVIELLSQKPLGEIQNSVVESV